MHDQQDASARMRAEMIATSRSVSTGGGSVTGLPLSAATHRSHRSWPLIAVGTTVVVAATLVVHRALEALAVRLAVAPLVLEIVGAVALLAVVGIGVTWSAQRNRRRLRAIEEAEQRVETHLREAERLRSAFLQGVSHELRTPLTNIVGYGLTLQDHLSQLDRTTAGQVTDRLVENARRLEQLIVDLLDLERRADELPLRGDVVRLDAVVDDALARVDTSTHMLRVKTERVHVAIDRTALVRVVEELVRNAVRHTPPGTKIWVFVAVRGQHVRITVEDEGGGIEPQLRHAVFEPFRQGDEVAASASPGLGIGLALVRRCVEEQAGELHLRHSAFGGARFEVVLPRGRVVPAHRTAARPAAARTAPAVATHARRRASVR